jgi:hypothetical protein
VLSLPFLLRVRVGCADEDAEKPLLGGSKTYCGAAHSSPTGAGE